MGDPFYRRTFICRTKGAILNANPVVLYDVTSVGSNYQYNYSLSGVSLLQNEAGYRI